jgi:hypothetical protein
MARGVSSMRAPFPFHPQEKRVFCGFVFIGYTVLMVLLLSLLIFANHGGCFASKQSTR